MSEQVQVNIEILDRNFAVNTPVAEKEVLEKAAQMLNHKIAAVQKSAANWENDKVVMMASLNLSYDLFKIIKDSQNQALADEDRERKINALIQQCDEALSELTS